MKKSLLLTFAITLLSAATATAQTEQDTITDRNFVYPESFESTRDMMDNWYLQRYTVLDSLGRRYSNEYPSDAVYIDRLRRLPTVIEMPYNQVVKGCIEMYANRKPELVERMLGMSLYYMPIFEEALERYQMPLELKYLPIIESALNPNAVSKAGAAGLWQFMPGTGQNEGLEVNSLVDQRRDPYASSDAAARYLQKLYNTFGDWHLAIAAYNCGPGNVNKAIARAGGGKKTYWQIYNFLPQETRGYVPAFIAANYIMNYYGEHGISPVLARRPLTADTVHVTRRVHFNQIAEVLDIPVSEIEMLNPQYRENVIPGNIKPYTLTLPSVQAYCYIANEDSIVNHKRELYQQPGFVSTDVSNTISGRDDKGAYVEELIVKKHKVARNETLASIAKKYGVTASSIKNANGLRSNTVKRGTTLNIPTYRRTYVPDDQVPADDQQQAADLTQPTPDDSAPTDTVTVIVQDAFANAEPAPQPEPAPAPVQTQPKKKAQPQYATHTVKKGESLGKIANRYGTTVANIKRINNLKSDTIHPGQKLKVPQK